jgi:hypothetical protein
MRALDCANLSIASYAVYERYFIYLNERSGQLRKTDSRTEGYYATGANGAELIGGENIWKIVLDVVDMDVARRAIRCINSLYQNMPPDRVRSVVQLRTAHIGTCMSYVTASVDPLNELRLHRCLILLKAFIEGFSDEQQAAMTDRM